MRSFPTRNKERSSAVCKCLPHCSQCTPDGHQRHEQSIDHQGYSDRRLITVLASLYVVSLMDRLNLSTATIAGLDDDLGLQVGTRYSIIIATFFVAYTVFQPLGTILTRKVGPRWFLSSIVLAWGAVVIGSGFVSTWQQLAGLRVLLG